MVTANKALLAEAGNELFRVAQDTRRHIGFEASVWYALLAPAGMVTEVTPVKSVPSAAVPL